jgi:uncharacterized protein (DUF736 family)
MGTRIGVLWRKVDKEGAAYLTGNIGTEAGLCIPAHVKVQVSLRKNDQKKEGDNRPDFFIEAWEPKEQRSTTGGAPGDDEVPF